MKKSKLLQDIGLNETATTLYLQLLEDKKSTVLDLSRATKIARTSVYNNLAILKEWGLVGEGIEGNKKFLYPESPENLINAVQIKEKLAQQAAEMLQPTFERGKYESKIKFAYGEEGFKKFAYDMINSGEKEVRQMINFDTLMSYANKKFFDTFWQERKKNGVHAKILTSINEKLRVKETSSEKDNYEMLREIKYLPKEIDIELSIVVYGNKVQFFAPQEEGYTFVFESKSFAQTINSLFDFLWSISIN